MFTRAPRGKEKKENKARNHQLTLLPVSCGSVSVRLFVCLFVYCCAVHAEKRQKQRKKSFSEIEIKINVVAPEAFLAGQQIHGGRFFWRFFFLFSRSSCCALLVRWRGRFGLGNDRKSYSQSCRKGRK